MSEEIHTHDSRSPGLTMEGPKLEVIPNHGKPCWKATCDIGTIFGSEVHGGIEAYGATKEKALENLEKERVRLYESIWA